MLNHEIMELHLARLNVLDLHMAIQGIIFDFENEIRINETSEDRKRIAQSSIDNRWKPLLETIEKQFEEQDK